MSAQQKQFEDLVENYYRAWFRYHPEVAVDLGVTGYAHMLTPYGNDDIGALVVLNEKLLSSLDEINEEALDADQKMDFDLLKGSAEIELFKLMQLDWRMRDPVRFVSTRAIHQLTIRPVEGFAEALRARLTAIPTYLRGGRVHLSEQPELIPVEWLDMAVTQAHQGSIYLRGLHHHPMVADLEVNELLDEAARAMEEFANFLQSELAAKAAGKVACGREHYEQLLWAKHFLPVDADQLYDIGERLFNETLSELKALTKKLQGDEDYLALSKQLQKKHPEAGDLVAAYSEQMNAAKEFLQTHDLVTLPENEHLQVVETPLFLRHEIPFAAYVDPMPGDPAQQGYYYVTPVESDEQLGEHNPSAIALTSVHEAWPGHHLQFVTSNSSDKGSSWTRLVNPSSVCYEGWALYCEQLMQEQGFLDQDAQHFIMLKDRLWRTLRVMIDVDIHARGIPLEQAADKLVSHLGFAAEHALAEVRWYSRAASVPMGYAIGWALITSLREAAGAESDLKSFHDRLLAGGTCALPLIMQRYFSEDVAKGALEKALLV